MSRAALAGLLAIGGLALALAGCASTGPGAPMIAAPPPPPPPPPPVEVSTILGDGTFHTAHGARASCAGQSVAIMAETANSRARMAALYGSLTHAVAPISQIQQRSAKLGPASDLVDSTQCGPDGHFSFTGLHAGGFFLIARVRLDHPDHGLDQLVVMQAVSLRTGETQSVRLAP